MPESDVIGDIIKPFKGPRRVAQAIEIRVYFARPER